MIIRLFDLVERGMATAALRTELRMLLDNYGLTPKGAQDRRWLPPNAEEHRTVSVQTSGDHYQHLRVVDPGLPVARQRG